MAVWNENGWKKENKTFVESFYIAARPSKLNKLQFHQDQIQSLAISKRQIYIWSTQITFMQMLFKDHILVRFSTCYSVKSNEIWQFDSVFHQSQIL